MSNELAVTYEKGRSPIIKGFIPGLPERGHIKIGKKGAWKKSSKGNDFQLPEKLDHFIITTMERDDTGNFVKDKALYEKLKLPDKPKEIPISLIYNDITANFRNRLTCYHGRKLFCSGDGEYAHRREEEGKPTKLITCPCERRDKQYEGSDPCKETAVFSVLIRGANVLGGVWKFRTTSGNSQRNLLSQMLLIKGITNGVLAGIDLILRVGPQTTIDPVTGDSRIIYVVSIDHEGTEEELRESVVKRLKNDKNYFNRVALLESEAIKTFSVEDIEGDANDVVDEFHPDQAKKDMPNLNPDMEVSAGKQGNGKQAQNEPDNAEDVAEDTKPDGDDGDDGEEEPVTSDINDGFDDKPGEAVSEDKHDDLF